MQDDKLVAKLLFGVAGVTALAFGALSVAVARGLTHQWDERMKRASHDAFGSGDGAQAAGGLVRAATPVGKWWGQLPPSLALSFRLLRGGRGAAACTIAGTAVAAALLPPLLDRVLPHRSPPTERGEPSVQSFPSGHALQTSAVALTTGFVLWRERQAGLGSFASLGAVPVLAGLNRLLLDRHFVTDLMGGYLAGISLGAVCAGAYELSRG